MKLNLFKFKLILWFMRCFPDSIDKQKPSPSPSALADKNGFYSQIRKCVLVLRFEQTSRMNKTTLLPFNTDCTSEHVCRNMYKYG